jgi:hypothetical protein
VFQETEANLILQRFKINHLRAGDMLLTGPLMMVFQQEGFSGEDLQKGLDYASELTLDRDRQHDSVSNR